LAFVYEVKQIIPTGKATDLVGTTPVIMSLRQGYSTWPPLNGHRFSPEGFAAPNAHTTQPLTYTPVGTPKFTIFFTVLGKFLKPLRVRKMAQNPEPNVSLSKLYCCRSQIQV
jgi:hypothetical protein